MGSIFKKIGLFFLDIIEVAVIALAIFVLVYLFLFQPHQVKGNSMHPSFEDGQYILTDKISYRFSEPQRGDVVVFKAPKNEKLEYIKRIIGLPGEKVKISNGNVMINDELLNEDYLQSSLTTSAGAYLMEGETGYLADGEYFVMGDNRNHSSDSRDWGFVPVENIMGKTFFRYWPLTQFGVIHHINY